MVAPSPNERLTCTVALVVKVRPLRLNHHENVHEQPKKPERAASSPRSMSDVVRGEMGRVTFT